MNPSFFNLTGIAIALQTCVGMVWYKVSRRLNLSAIDGLPATSLSYMEICRTQTFAEGGVNNSEEPTNKLDVAVKKKKHNYNNN